MNVLEKRDSNSDLQTHFSVTPSHLLNNLQTRVAVCFGKYPSEHVYSAIEPRVPFGSEYFTSPCLGTSRFKSHVLSEKSQSCYDCKAFVIFVT